MCDEAASCATIFQSWLRLQKVRGRKLANHQHPAIGIRLSAPHVAGRINVHDGKLAFPLKAAYDKAMSTLEGIRTGKGRGEELSGEERELRRPREWISV